MCQKRSSVIMYILDDNYLDKQIRVDPCIRNFIISLNLHGYKTVGCCCGHSRYPLTVICKDDNITTSKYYELISGIRIPRTRNFYKTDSEGYYYIPELINE